LLESSSWHSIDKLMIYGELGLLPIEIDVKFRMISYWARLLTGKETKLSYLSYTILYNLSIDENLDFSWIKHAKHICVLPLFNTSNITFVAFSACFLIVLLKFPVMLNTIPK
jgi:hypothetical protein